METTSWVVVDKSNGKAVLETFSKRTANAINRERYHVVPIMKYLTTLNRNIRAGNLVYTEEAGK